MKDGYLVKWLREKNCMSKENITHLCLDGGTLSIPDDLFLEFFSIYLNGLEKDEKYYICEKPSDVCKMFCDFDFLEDTAVTLEDIKKYLENIYNIIKEYFGDEFTIIICSNESKKVKGKIKSGFHLVWDELYVTSEQALGIAKLFIEKLDSSVYSWKDIIDTVVYTNGLRMIYSSKMHNEKKKNENGKTYIKKSHEGREYVPVLTYPENSFDINDKPLMIQKCSIRTYCNEYPLEPVISIPHFVVPEIKKRVKDDLFFKIEQFIQYQTLEQWNLPLKSFRKQNNFYIAKNGSMYCLNVVREHNSCGVYFQFTEAGMFQRCFCKCNTVEGRVTRDLCSKFKSKPFIIPLELRKLLFPGKTTKKKVVKKGNNGSMSGVEVFGSNILLKNKKTLQEYLKMSLNTIKEIEKKCR
jgi:hypothetical protein